MKKTTIALTLLLTSIIASNVHAQSEKTVLLNCFEKWSSFKISKQGGQYIAERSVVLDRVKGNPYVSGTISTESYAVIEAVSTSKTSDSLIFNLEGGTTLAFKLDRDAHEDTVNVKIISNAENVEIQMGAILGVEQNELSFYSVEACEIK